MNRIGFTASAALLLLAGCGDRNAGNRAENAVVPDNMATNAMSGANASGAVIPIATAALKSSAGAAAGIARAEAVQDSLKISIDVEGLPAGQHGVHVHMTGRCDGPKFESAGSHWNPAGAKHGLDNPQGQHAGDMPNLIVRSDGHGTLEYILKGGTREGLLDADGSAIVVHAKVDDQKTDPSGNSGDRIACGVFRAG